MTPRTTVGRATAARTDLTGLVDADLDGGDVRRPDGADGDAAGQLVFDKVRAPRAMPRAGPEESLVPTDHGGTR
jgi:hypothetical protein